MVSDDVQPGGADAGRPRQLGGHGRDGGRRRMTAPRDTFTHGHHDSVLRSHRWRTVANSAAYLRQGLSLLDVGCGPGTLSIDLARHVAPGPVLAIDATEDVLDEARRHAALAGVTTIEFRVADAYDLDLADGSFDVVHAHQVLQHVSDPVAMLRELRRVVREDGVVGVRDADYAWFVWYPEDPGLERWLELYHAVARGNDAEPDAGRRLLGWARDAGSAEVTPSASVWCHATEEDRAWWSDLWADRIRSSALAAQVLVRGLTDAAELEDVAAAWRRWGTSDRGWLTILHGEVVCRG
jgi:SAM-dependent methyltransferase